MYIVSKYTQKTMHTIYKDTHKYQCAASIAHAQMTAYSTQCLEAIYITSKHLHFNPPRVWWDFMGFFRMVDALISIHPPRVGWDHSAAFLRFNDVISIHPPRVGWDQRKRKSAAGQSKRRCLIKRLGSGSAFCLAQSPA